MPTYNIQLNMIKVNEWGINLSQATLFDLYSKSVSWATEMIHEGKTYYWCSRNKVIDEIPVLTDKPDTVYRLTKDLAEHGLIEYAKINGRDCIRLTEKGKTWNSEKNPPYAQNSEKNPSELGKKSEGNSEKFPTDNYTSIDNTTRDKKKKAHSPENFKKVAPNYTNNLTYGAYERLWDVPIPQAFKEKLNGRTDAEKILGAISEKWDTFCKVRYTAHNKRFHTDISEAQALSDFLRQCKSLDHAMQSLDAMIGKEAINPFVVEYKQQTVTAQSKRLVL